LRAALLSFTPFDPATKISEAMISDRTGHEQRVVKGAPGAVASLAPMSASAKVELDALTHQGLRVLAVAAGPVETMTLMGFVGLSDPPRSDSKELIGELRSMGVQTVMVTGDAAATAGAVAHDIGLDGPICPPGRIPESVTPIDFAVYAGVFPEDKFRLVKAFQRQGRAVAMCGDGANDAPALRQAQMGVAVSTATDVAKSAASIVLTEPGLSGIVRAIKEGRSAFQRVLSYVLNALIKKFELVLFLGAGLIMTGHAILTPALMALLLVTGDFITMSLATDKARPSPVPDKWRVRNITAAAAILGLFKLMFSVGVLAFGKYGMALGAGELQTLAFITLVFGGQATVYVVRERRSMWGSRPSAWLAFSSVLDVGIASSLASAGIMMAALPGLAIVLVLIAAFAFAAALDVVKRAILYRLRIS
jgi:H+-transporting ATPase